jgi:hypothetical protein
MLSLKTTTALIAAISVIATASVASALTPLTSQAFAQNNTVTAFQSNSLEKKVDQDINQYGSASTNDDRKKDDPKKDDHKKDGGTAIVAQEASQGFCELTNQQNAAAGNDANNTAANVIVGSASGFGSENQGVNCS